MSYIAPNTEKTAMGEGPWVHTAAWKIVVLAVTLKLWAMQAASPIISTLLEAVPREESTWDDSVGGEHTSSPIQDLNKHCWFDWFYVVEFKGELGMV